LLFIDNKTFEFMQETFMKRAIEMSEIGIQNGGGPFGALIVRKGEIISEAHNTVTIGNDPLLMQKLMQFE